jgi:hypothetical protein
MAAAEAAEVDPPATRNRNRISFFEGGRRSSASSAFACNGTGRLLSRVFVCLSRPFAYGPHVDHAGGAVDVAPLEPEQFRRPQTRSPQRTRPSGRTPGPASRRRPRVGPTTRTAASPSPAAACCGSRAWPGSSRSAPNRRHGSGPAAAPVSPRSDAPQGSSAATRRRPSGTDPRGASPRALRLPCRAASAASRSSPARPGADPGTHRQAQRSLRVCPEQGEMRPA